MLGSGKEVNKKGGKQVEPPRGPVSGKKRDGKRLQKDSTSEDDSVGGAKSPKKKAKAQVKKEKAPQKEQKELWMYSKEAQNLKDTDEPTESDKERMLAGINTRGKKVVGKMKKACKAAAEQVFGTSKGRPIKQHLTRDGKFAFTPRNSRKGHQTRSATSERTRFW